jgi:hypothetical protein
VEYENTETMDGALVEAEETSEMLEVVSEVVQPPPKVVDHNTACNVRRKIEDHLERKRYREQQGEEFNLEELMPA